MDQPLDQQSDGQKRKKVEGRSQPKNKGEFYEMMPNAYIDPPNLFYGFEEESKSLEDEAVRKKIAKQLTVLVLLLLFQFVLFAVLIQSTVNLG